MIDFGIASNALLQVDGTIDAVSAGALALGSSMDVSVSVAASGRISADGVAISSLGGLGGSITNEGRIVSRGDFGLDLGNGLASRVFNDGTLKAAFSAVRFGTGSIDGVLVNSGRIIATTGGYAAVDFGSSQGRIENSGLIRGDIGVSLLGNGAYLANSGRIVGDTLALQGGAFGQTIINSGKILGAIDLGDGNDQFFARDGSMTSEAVEGGGGNDVLLGSKGDDDFSGGSGSDRLAGRGGADMLDGGADDDAIRGGGGSDRIEGGAGNDVLYGGRGNDIITDVSGDDDQMYGGGGNDRITGGDDSDTMFGGAGNDRLIGRDGMDALNGDNGNDVICGDGGDDSINGGNGNDKLMGGDDNDRLFGGNGRDVLKGGSGSDLLAGDGGNDRMTGGTGEDIFYFAGASTGRDTITDFEHGYDRLDLIGYDVAGAGGFASEADFFAAAVSVTAGGDVRIDLSVLDTADGTIILLDVGDDFDIKDMFF
ncbi:MAG TPA: calcium-binding protein, partial [Rhodobacterales bacterium]|nr:calcium-binding protein [Rhodobacterales bacterium]